MNQYDPMKVEKFLTGMDYPCGRRLLVRHADGNGADPDTITRLQGLPLHVAFGDFADVNTALYKAQD